MVKSVTSLTRNGLRDWLLQRVTAIYLAIALIVLVGYLMLHPVMEYYDWQQLFSHQALRIAAFLFFLCLIVHAWIGIWTVCTDYLKCGYLRLTVYSVVALVLLATLIWSAAILWGQ